MCFLYELFIIIAPFFGTSSFFAFSIIVYDLIITIVTHIEPFLLVKSMDATWPL